MIHEGTHGIQALDLLGRKVLMEGGRGLDLLSGRITTTIGRARKVPALADHVVPNSFLPISFLRSSDTNKLLMYVKTGQGHTRDFSFASPKWSTTS